MVFLRIVCFSDKIDIRWGVYGKMESGIVFFCFFYMR